MLQKLDLGKDLKNTFTSLIISDNTKPLEVYIRNRKLTHHSTALSKQCCTLCEFCEMLLFPISHQLLGETLLLLQFNCATPLIHQINIPLKNEILVYNLNYLYIFVAGTLILVLAPSTLSRSEHFDRVAPHMLCWESSWNYVLLLVVEPVQDRH